MNFDKTLLPVLLGIVNFHCEQKAWCLIKEILNGVKYFHKGNVPYILLVFVNERRLLNVIVLYIISLRTLKLGADDVVLQFHSRWKTKDLQILLVNGYLAQRAIFALMVRDFPFRIDLRGLGLVYDIFLWESPI